MIHEFTHALHWADQEARGQNHPIWIAEGFATLAETSEIENGHLVPLPNPRLNYLKKAVQSDKLIPLRSSSSSISRSICSRPSLVTPRAATS